MGISRFKANIRQALVFLYFLAWFPLLSYAQDSVNFESADQSSSGEDALSDVFFNFSLPNNMGLLLLFSGLILSIFLGVLLYRAMLKSQITKGVHPRQFFTTIIFMVLGLFLLFVFFILTQGGITGLGWFTVLTGIYLFFFIIFLLMGRLLKWVLVLLVLITAIIGFQLTNLGVF